MHIFHLLSVDKAFHPYIACTLWLAHDSTILIRSIITIWRNTVRLFGPLFGTEANIWHSPNFYHCRIMGGVVRILWDHMQNFTTWASSSTVTSQCGLTSQGLCPGVSQFCGSCAASDVQCPTPCSKRWSLRLLCHASTTATRR